MPCGLSSLYQALRHCHEDAVPGFRLMHRDVKPDNIGFLEDGRPRVCVRVLSMTSAPKLLLSTYYAPYSLTYQARALRLRVGEAVAGGAYNARMSQCYLSKLWEKWT